MSPTIFRYKRYRFFFFSREEKRPHVHVSSSDGEAKFWINPAVGLADHEGMTVRELNEIEKVIKEKKREIRLAWDRHFKS